MITQAILQYYLKYDPETGIFTWIENTSAYHKKIGKVAGGINTKGYHVISIFGIKYYASRLAWLYMTGIWPENEIDHIDTCRPNNRWINLREATHSQNSKNYSKPKTNTSGYKGVCWNAKNNKFIAQIQVNDYRLYLGSFTDPKKAHSAYCQAALVHYGEFANPGVITNGA